MPLMCGVRTTDLWQKYLILRRQNVWLRPTLHFHPPFHAGGMLSGLYAAICSARMYVCTALVKPLLAPSFLLCRWRVVWAVCNHLQCPDVCMYGSGQTFALTLYYFVGSVLFGLYVCSHLQRSYVCMYVCMYGSVQTYALTL